MFRERERENGGKKLAPDLVATRRRRSQGGKSRPRCVTPNLGVRLSEYLSWWQARVMQEYEENKEDAIDVPVTRSRQTGVSGIK